VMHEIVPPPGGRDRPSGIWDVADEDRADNVAPPLSWAHAAGLAVAAAITRTAIAAAIDPAGTAQALVSTMAGWR
jgi:hypothetical protein